MASDLYLSSDLISEILSRTTLETLDTCKVVNKELNELINDPWFIQKYNQKTNNIFGYFVQTLRHNHYKSIFVSIDPTLKIPSVSIPSLEGDMQILASSNQGILCGLKYGDKSCQYYVCKPSTRQHAELPSPRKPGQSMEALALMILKSNPLHYKIIRYSKARIWSPEQDIYICEIFDSDIWTWRQSKNLSIKYCTFFRNQPAVCFGDVAYWLTSKDTVLAFNSSTETHHEFPAPTLAFGDDASYDKKHIVEYKGKLGFTCEYKCEKLLLWGLEDNRNYQWEIKKVVIIDENKNKLMGCSLIDMALMVGYRLEVYKQAGLFYSYPWSIFPFRSDREAVDLDSGGCNMLQLLGMNDD